MKKIALILLFVMLFALCACGEANSDPKTTEAPELTSTPIPEPTPSPEPEWEATGVRVGNAEVLWTSFDRGDNLEIIGEWEYYYVAVHEQLSLLVDKSFVRLDSEPAFEAAEAYARSKAKVYSVPCFNDESKLIAELGMNTKLNVIDGKDAWRLVEWEGGSGYMNEEDISSGYIAYGWGGGGGNGGGNSHGADGGDIPLAYYITGNPKIQFISNFTGTQQGTVLCNETEAYLTVFSRGDEVKLVERGEDESTILVGEQLVKIASRFLVSSDAQYEQWTGYAKRSAVVFKEYQLKTELHTPGRSDELQVLDEFAEVYVVSVNGETGYISKESVSTTKVYDSYSGGGGGAAPAQEWSAPVL